MKDDLTWLDHLTHAAEFANLVTVAAAKVADSEIQTALLQAAQVIDQRIEKGIVKAEAEMDALDPVNPPIRR